MGWSTGISNMDPFFAEVVSTLTLSLSLSHSFTLTLYILLPLSFLHTLSLPLSPSLHFSFSFFLALCCCLSWGHERTRRDSLTLGFGEVDRQCARAVFFHFSVISIKLCWFPICRACIIADRPSSNPSANTTPRRARPHHARPFAPSSTIMALTTVVSHRWWGDRALPLTYPRFSPSYLHRGKHNDSLSSTLPQTRQFDGEMQTLGSCLGASQNLMEHERLPAVVAQREAVHRAFAEKAAKAKAEEARFRAEK